MWKLQYFKFARNDLYQYISCSTSRMSKKIVLEEEEYVEALEQIIERDFFPDLPSLRQQSERLHGGGREVPRGSSVFHPSTAATGDTATTRFGFPLDSARSARRPPPASAARSELSSWDQPTPTRSPLDVEPGCDAESTVQVSLGDGDGVAEMGLNAFVATHTSEDNAAFTELQAKAIEDHKRRYHWAYDGDESKGDAKLLLLKNGEWITKEQRAIVDQVLAPKGAKDERPSAPETWPFRARNALLFPPELESTSQVCQINQSLPQGQKLLTSGDDTSSSLAVLKSEVASRRKPETVFANSRFPAAAVSSAAASTSTSTADKTATASLELVQMTPMIAPGVDASPLMTWGDIEGTPMILDPRMTPGRIAGGPSFEIQETSSREQVANRLEAQTRARKSQSRQRTPTPLVSRAKRPGSELPTPNRLASIRARLSSVRSVQRTPLLGGDSELRASYGTPLLPPRHSSSRSGKRKV